MDLPKGQTVVITGGNSGIGFECARYLAKCDGRVILAVRSPERGEAAKAKILEETPKARIEVWLLDLAEPQSIVDFIQRVIQERIDIDVFYANAGIYRMPFSVLYGGLESHMAVNLAANYLLYQGLRDYLIGLGHPVKFILTSSVVARLTKLNSSDLYGEPKYSKSRAYKKSKLAVNHLWLWMQEDAEGTNIIPLLVHPGSTYTPLIAKAYPKKLTLAAKRFMRLAFHKPDKAALCTMRLLEKDIQAPCFCGPRGIGHLSGYPKIYPLYRKNIGNPQEFVEELQSFLHNNLDR